LAIGDIAAIGPALKMARMAHRMTNQVTVYTDGVEELSSQLEPAVIKAGFTLDPRPILKLVKGPNHAEVIIKFADGTEKTEGFLVSCLIFSLDTFKLLIKQLFFQVHKPRTEVNGPFAQQLCLELTNGGDINTKPPFYETFVPGVFAVGDCGSQGKAVSQALATGVFGAAGIVAQLQAESLPENGHTEL
jgi:gliotoxin/aspirochlorine biosynthesis thioredoxin reductase